jgi:hypothetical protein
MALLRPRFLEILGLKVALDRKVLPQSAATALEEHRKLTHRLRELTQVQNLLAFQMSPARLSTR